MIETGGRGECGPHIKGSHSETRGEEEEEEVLVKIKCFRCGERGHYSTQYPLKKKEKDEKQDEHAALAKIDGISSKLEEYFTMFVDIPLGVRWGDLVL